jgi:hypothetical protein
MSWKAVALHQPFISPKKRLGIAGFIIGIVVLRIVLEYFEAGFTPRFWLYAGFALLASVWEWRHYNKPLEISLQLEDGRLEYNNHYSGERHTVYRSRTKRITQEMDTIVFHSEGGVATRMPLKFFNDAQLDEMQHQLADWGAMKDSEPLQIDSRDIHRTNK